MSTYIQDLDDVRALIQLYIDGSNGDVSKLKRAFHKDAWMMGRLGTADTIFPVETQPGMAGPNYKAILRTIDLAGEAGVAVLAETDFLGCDFVTYFTVAGIDGRWQITNKTYAHTGGTPPGQ